MCCNSSIHDWKKDSLQTDRDIFLSSEGCPQNLLPIRKLETLFLMAEISKLSLWEKMNTPPTTVSTRCCVAHLSWINEARRRTKDVRTRKECIQLQLWGGEAKSLPGTPVFGSNAGLLSAACPLCLLQCPGSSGWWCKDWSACLPPRKPWWSCRLLSLAWSALLCVTLPILKKKEKNLMGIL